MDGSQILVRVRRGIEIESDERGSGRQVAQHRFATKLSRGNTRHARAAERIENQVARAGVILDQLFYAFGRDFGVVGVSVVNVSVLAGCDVSAKWLGYTLWCAFSFKHHLS